jgi:hypothetical protein
MTCSRQGDCRFFAPNKGIYPANFTVFRVTCGLYVNMILSDYLRTILNLNRNSMPSDWKLDPREDFSQIFNSEGTPQGIGNQVSVEFNMIYRWHSAVSSQDEAWANGFFKQVFGPNASPSKAFSFPQGNIPHNTDLIRPSGTMSTDEFLQGLRKWARTLPADLENWTFGNMTRQEDGTFPDAELVRLLQAGTENVAGKYSRYKLCHRLVKCINRYLSHPRSVWG